MKNLDEKLVNIYELLSDYLEEVGYLEEKEVEDKEVDDEVDVDNDDKDDDKDETYTEEEVQEILNRE